jgi:hypothetical protein
MVLDHPKGYVITDRAYRGYPYKVIPANTWVDHTTGKWVMDDQEISRIQVLESQKSFVKHQKVGAKMDVGYLSVPRASEKSEGLEVKLVDDVITLSDFMKNKGLSSAQLPSESTWAAILGKEKGATDQESQPKPAEDHSPALSNGGYLFIEEKDGVSCLFLRKKGKKAFMTYHEASFLKERLGDGVDIVGVDGQSIDAKAQEGTGMFCLKIPLD